VADRDGLGQYPGLFAAVPVLGLGENRLEHPERHSHAAGGQIHLGCRPGVLDVEQALAERADLVEPDVDDLGGTAGKCRGSLIDLALLGVCHGVRAYFRMAGSG